VPLPIPPFSQAGRCRLPLLAGCSALCLLAGLAWRLSTSLEAATRPWAEIGGPAQSPARPTILFLFRASDCALALRDIERWNVLQNPGVIDVQGVVLDPPRRLPLDRLARLERIAFPIRDARRRDILPRLHALGVRHTPVSLVLDRQGGVRLVLPAARRADEFALVDSVLASP
jgi:hypothetical protein